ncbi:uncharacterized protein EKO05_0007134 [Ascochyta rabiei]|uniref:Xylanolytic transcriptional activator regulatory domain-containing protein n=1 Tax=Didymella rabiei TaxID=5454 RepID=A0A163FHK3_DIDRA|nr:uncharacterized protein EKO05_0007134 [Ascochyta rabiei]KZM24369.1 hypothetical protein ST47_g4469 [Ascochyta rabiei]UPX16747.1 hypothetical protein EKO05_0007134 [Ascochyta rabiei]
MHSRPPSFFGGSDVELNVQSAPKPAGSGYYGPTSYYSVFDRVDHVPTATTDSQPSRPAGDTLSAGIRQDDPGLSRSLQLGSWILQNLQHVSIIQSLVDMYIRTSQVSPTATLIPLKAVETLQHLASGDVHVLAQKTTRNTQKPLQVPPEMHASTFSTLFTGDNLRWEFLGLVFAWAGLSLSMSLLNGKGSATTPDGISKTSFAQLLTACSDACITLCRQNAHTNDLLSWCLYENLILLTFQHGEASHASWQRLGDLSTDILALGLHKEPAATSTSPIFLVQARKKLFSAAFRVDKSISTFFGRPPRIPGHYCDIGLPLDVDDHLFHQENFCVDHLRSVLDMAGWNIDCKIRPASWIRMRHTLGKVTEEILELSLGGAQDNLVCKVQDILTRCNETWNRIPSHLQYKHSCWNDGTPPGTCLMLLLVYLEHLQNEFQLQRLLCRQQRCASDALIKISMRMLTAVMILPGIQVDSVNIHRDRAWMLLYYALPSAGVLAIDLRMRMQQGSNPPRSISKSEVIRHTSVLAASLQWASEPSGGNHNLCAGAAKTLSRILEEILDSSDQRSEMSTSGTVSGTMSGGVSGNMSPRAMDMDYSMLAEHGVDSETFLNWFDNLEWETMHQPVPLQV